MISWMEGVMRMCKVEADFYYHGYRVVCLFMEGGFRCGYVGIRNGKSLKQSFLDRIRCHGGITYSKNHLPEQSQDGYWYIGFDCNHQPFDGHDIKTAETYFAGSNGIISRLSIYPLDGHYKTLDYVEQQCRSIIRQLEEAA